MAARSRNYTVAPPSVRGTAAPSVPVPSGIRNGQARRAPAVTRTPDRGNAGGFDSRDKTAFLRPVHEANSPGTIHPAAPASSVSDTAPMNGTANQTVQSKRAAAALKNRHGIPSPLKGIRLNCIECSGGSPKVVSECAVTGCPLWPFRFGRNPKPDDLRAPLFNTAGDLVGWQEWQGYGEPMNCLRAKGRR